MKTSLWKTLAALTLTVVLLAGASALALARYPAPGGAFLPPKNRVGWDRAHMHCYYSFLDAVSRGVPASPDIFEGARLQRLMDAMARSHRESAWVDFSR